MSLFCSISGTQPLKPVVSKASGHVYEKDLVLKALRDNDGKDPITGEQMQEDDLIDIKTAPAQPTAPPRAPTFTSVPSLLHTLQQEWDATMLECLELRRQGAELRQELSHALYKEDAAMRVLARVTRERDEAREALASVKATLGPAFSTGGAAEGDAQMEGVEEAAEAALPADARQKVEETAAALSAGRRKRKPTADDATPDVVKTFTQTATVPSLHTTKPPGVSALNLAKGGQILVTGGLDKDVIVFDRSTGKNIAKLKGHTKKVTSVVASTTLTEEGYPSFVVSSSLDQSVRIWTPNGGKQVYGCSSNLALGGEVAQLALHPSNAFVVAAVSTGEWVLVDVAAEQARTIVTGALPDAEAGTANTAVAFHPDGGLFGVGASDAKLRLFDLVTLKCVASFEGHSAEPDAKAIVSLSFSENGYNLASAAAGSKQVKIWDLRKMSNPANIDLSSDEGASVSAVAYDYSAQFLAVVGSDARVYQHKTYELLAKADDNAAELTAVQWGKDSQELVVVGLDRTARILSAPQSE
ncbi:hypothetical protein JCM10207_003520 [Rhodosporidiobolus poonsookiae]